MDERVVLASASPRRRAMLQGLGLPFDALALDIDERPLAGESPQQTALRLAAEKARRGAARYPGRVAIGADTLVLLENEVLGKPQSADEAGAMLRRLRGCWHQVITAVAAGILRQPQDERASRQPQVWSRAAMARVLMRDYSEPEIAAYVASGEPFDKAGGYAIQDPVLRPAASFEGCFLTVVGLPLPELFAVLGCAGAPQPLATAATLEAVCPGCRDRAVLLGVQA